MSDPVRAGLQELLDEGLGHGMYSGAAAAISTPHGRAVAWTGAHAQDDARPVDGSSLFDLASVSKTFTAATLVRLIESKRIDPDEPVSRLLPVSSGAGAEAITLRMLLTHTSGLPAESFLWRDPGLPAAERLARVLATPLETAPDAVYRYSCLGYIAAGALAERVTGASLAELLDELVLGPLGLDSVGYGPVDRERALATEDESWVGRGMVRGEVHDELNWFLGGRVGNAGLFGTVGDVLGFAESFVTGRLLTQAGLRAMTTDALEPRHGAGFGQAFGPRLGDPDFLGDVPGLGHVGFTGTMWIAIPATRVAAVLLTNRVHPQRDRVDLAPFRRRFSAWAASAGMTGERGVGEP